MGKRIDDLPNYGSSDIDKKLSDIFEVSKNSGTSGSPVYASDGSRQIKISELATLLGITIDGGYIKKDGSVAFTGDESMGGHSLTDVDQIQQRALTAIDITNGNIYDLNENIIVDYSDRLKGFGIFTNNNWGYIKSNPLTVDRTYQLPDQSGTFAMVGDLSGYLSLSGGTMTGDISLGGHALTHTAAFYDTSNVISLNATTRGLLDVTGSLILSYANSLNGIGIITAGQFAFIKSDNLTSTHTYQFPDTGGTFAMAATTLAGYGITDAYTKTQIDGFLTGLDWKNHVQAATIVNITLSGTQTIDTYAAQIGDRILVQFQTLGKDNGIWIVASGAWTRATDADTGLELIAATVYVENGSANKGIQYTCSNTGVITIGITTITFVQISGPGTYNAGTGLTLTAGQFSIDSTVVTLTGSQAVSNKTGLVSQWTNDSNYLVNTLVSGNIFIGNGSNVATGVSLSGDATITNSGSLTNTGIQGKSISLAAGFLKYNGSAFVFDNSTYLTTISGITAGGDLSGTYATPSVVWSNGYTTYDARYLALSGGTLVGNLNGVTPTELTYLSGVTSGLQNQINNLNSGLAAKVAARILVGTNVTISSPGSTLDGITMSSGDSVVLNGQSTGSQNGVYIWNGSAVPMTRRSDCTTGGTGSSGVLGMTITIEEGTNADQIWMLITNTPITVGTTSLSYIKSSNTTYTGSNGITLIANNFTLDNSYFSGEISLSAGVATLANSAVIGKVLTGFASGAGTVTATDSLLSMANKLNGNIAAKFTLPSLTVGSVIYSDGTTLVQDNSNLYFASHLLSVGTSGDFAGTDPVNIYKQFDSFTPNNSDNGYTVSHSRGSHPSFTESLADDYIGPFAYYGYNGSAWVETASIRGYVEGATSTNRGARIEFWSKANGGSLTKAGLIDSNQRWAVGSGTAIGQFNQYYTKTGLASYAIAGGATTINTTGITFTSNTTIKVGDMITGTGIPANTFVVSCTTTTAVLSKLATATNSSLSLTGLPSDFGNYTNVSFTDGASHTAFFGNYIDYKINSTTTSITNRGLVVSMIGTTGGFTGGSAAAEFITDLTGTGIIITNTAATTNATWQMGIGAGSGLSNGVFGIGLAGVTPLFSMTQSSSAITLALGASATNVVRSSTASIPLTLQGGSGGATTSFTSVVINQNAAGGNIAATSGVINGCVVTPGTIAPTSGNLEYNHYSINSTYNYTGTVSGAKIRGCYYNPILTSVTGLTNIAFEATSGMMLLNGDIKLQTAGNGIYVKEGTNATMGRGTLVGGTLTINTTKVTSTCEIFIGDAGGGVLANAGALYEDRGSRVNGTSFVVKSLNVLDTSNFCWIIIEAA